MRSFLFAGLAVLGATAAGAQSTATLRGIDVYRSSTFSADEARRIFGDRLVEYVHWRNEHLPGLDAKAEKLRQQMQAEVLRRPGIVFAELNFAEFFTSVDHAMYAVFDVVDEADSARLSFKPLPHGVHADPDGLLAAWRRYMTVGETLSQRGEMSFERPNCPGFYCLWSGTADIDSLQQRFKEGAAKHFDDLHRILAADKDGERRTEALFVLSYAESGRAVLGYCQEGLSDSDARVRGAALQILADIANHHPELPIALGHVLPCLDDPSAAVRGKAMGLLVPLAAKEAYREVMLSSAPRLVDLLKMHQPESNTLAYTLLGILSRKDYDRNDYAAWEKWAKKVGP